MSATEAAPKSPPKSPVKEQPAAENWASSDANAATDDFAAGAADQPATASEDHQDAGANGGEQHRPRRNQGGQRRAPRGEPREPVQRDPAEEARKVFVGNLAYAATQDDVVALFSAAGEIDKVVIAASQGRPKGYAFVTFKDEASVAKAVTDLHKAELKDRTINVEAAAHREPRKPRQPRATPRDDAQEGETAAEGEAQDGQRRERRRSRNNNKPRRAKSAGGAAAEEGQARGESAEAAQEDEGAKPSRAPRRRNRGPKTDAAAATDGEEAHARRAPREPRKPLSETGTPMPTTIYLRQLPQGVKEDEIAAWVQDHGFTPVKVAVFHKPGSPRFRAKDFAFVELESTEAQAKAVETLHGKEFKGKALVVQVAYEKVERHRRNSKKTAAAASQDAEGQEAETKDEPTTKEDAPAAAGEEDAATKEQEE